MKKITKFLVVSSVLAMLFAVPVMAKEVSISADNTDYLLTLINNNNAKVNNDLAAFIKAQSGPAAETAIAQQTALVNSTLAKINKEVAENHIVLLEKKVYNAKQLEATRLAQLNNFKSLMQMSNTWAPKLDMVQKEYDRCVNARAAAEANLADAKVKLAPYL